MKQIRRIATVLGAVALTVGLAGAPADAAPRHQDDYKSYDQKHSKDSSWPF